MSLLKGIVASSGIAFGKAYKLLRPDLLVEHRPISKIENEFDRLHKAINKTEEQINTIRSQVAEQQGEENAAIFDAHILMLNDEEYIQSIKQTVYDEKINVESALQKVTNLLISTFKQLNNLYTRERVADIEDVTDRLLANLLGVSLPNIGLIEEKTILIATDLKPSETIQMSNNYVQGFVTDSGAETSHSAIIARSLDLSAIVGARYAMSKIKNGDEIIVDGIDGIVLINPSEEQKKRYKAKKFGLDRMNIQLNKYKNKPTITSDNYPLQLAANIHSPNDVERVLKSGVDGIGLYRTEFLFMEHHTFPSEQKQFNMYKTVLEKMDNKPVAIRTLDIGGDKQLPYLSMSEEANPFLGLRAIRFSLKEKEIFKTQLRALLRASIFGNLKILFPMITTIEELRETKQVLNNVMLKLHEEKIQVAEKIDIGMMIETPAAAILIDQFASEVDFFSIGTNDLIQYSFAVDRMNENVAYLYNPFHPAILRIIKHIIDSANRHGKYVKICGEMAADERIIPLLIGLGLDTFSMDTASILKIRHLIKSLSKEELIQIADNALQAKTAEEVKGLLKF